MKYSIFLTLILILYLSAPLLSISSSITVFDSNYFDVASSPTSLRSSAQTYSSQAPMLTASATGTRKVLVILIDFPDRAGVNNRTYYQSLLFSNATGSLKNYYEEVSYGQFTVKGTIAGVGWYRSTKNMTYWGADTLTNHDDKNGPIYNLAKEAIGKADADVDFKAYDKNGDGALQTSELNIWIVHAGSGQESTSSPNDIYSHYWGIPGVGFDSFTDSYVDGVRLSKHFESENVGGYAMDAEDSPVGTFAHEFGHDLGLPDLYNMGGGGEFVGRWDIMATGNWNGNPQGSSPAHFTSWSKIKLGWISTPDIITVNTRQVVNVTIEPLETSKRNSVVKISTGSTYYLVEVRQRILYDTSLPDYGVVILYCDDSIGTGNGPVKVMNAHPSDKTLNDAPFNIGTGENTTFTDAARGITITILSVSNSSFLVRVNYNAANFRISTDPSGLIIQVDGKNYTAPYIFTWASGSNHNISVSDIQRNGSVRYLFLNWSDGSSRTHTITANASDITITASYRAQYKVSLSFKTSDGSGWLSPSQCQIAGSALNSTLITLRSFSNIWLDDERWTLIQVLWQGNNVVPNATVSYMPAAQGNWTINCSVYFISFTDAFKANDGSALYAHPTSFQLIFPNSTSSASLSSTSSLLLQNGSYELRSVYWQGNDVTPADNRFTYTSSSVKKSFSLRIYKIDFTDSFKDGKGSVLSTVPSGLSLLCPNGTSTGLLPTGAYLLQAGAFKLRLVSWKGFEVSSLSDSDSVFNSVDGNPRLNLAISNLTIILKDFIGLPVSDAKVNMVYLANNTTVATASTGSDGKITFSQLPYGDYRAETMVLGSTSNVFALAGDKTVEMMLLSYSTLGIFLVVIAVTIGIVIFRVKWRHPLRRGYWATFYF